MPVAGVWTKAVFTTCLTALACVPAFASPRVLGYEPNRLDDADVARLSAYHFARQFKAATGLSPYQYVIVRCGRPT